MESSKLNSNIAHYRILSRIGAGGMGEVYLAEDTRLYRKAALKLLLPEFISNEDRLRRFIQEARAAAALNHPNIAHIYEVGEADGTHYIAMEFVDGDTLATNLRQSSLGALLKHLSQVAEGLAKAHAAGIVHRDLKPDNIMITRDGYVKILDFGLAKLVDIQPRITSEDAATAVMPVQPLSVSGTVMGTVGYMSPEQAQGKPVDQRSDIFSFGCILYEAAAGRRPFEGESAIDTLHKIIYSTATPITDLNPSLPADLQRIVRRCLAKEPERRYQTIRDVANDLEDLRRDIEIDAENRIDGVPEKSSNADSVLQTNKDSVDAARGKTDSLSTSSTSSFTNELKAHKLGIALILISLVALATAASYFAFYAGSPSTTINSLAVMPFVNLSNDADVEYLSDGMTETLLSNLSRLPKLSVKARSSVFRFKGKEANPQAIGKELNVQAILNGRVTQRGDQITLSLELIDAKSENIIWAERYNRKQTDLVTLQSEIARDVSRKLQTRLSGADVQNVTKNYTENAEAYQLYLRGRYHIFKLLPLEIHKGISYFQQAIDLDPNYALAYVGLSDAYRGLALSAEVLPGDVIPKGRAASEKAVALDDRLSEAHSSRGMNLFWYAWDWKAAENEFKRALELNDNNADAHLFYAHMLSNSGRHAEAFVEVKRARELDPLSLFVNSLEAQFLIHGGRTDEALDRLQKTFELSPNFWMAHLFAASGYIEKRIYDKAIAEAEKARELSPAQTFALSLKGYALALSGKRVEARGALNELLKLSTERFVPPYHIAFLYNALGDKEEALVWLERGIEQQDPKMAFLLVEPKWSNLRDNPRFQAVLKRIG